MADELKISNNNFVIVVIVSLGLLFLAIFLFPVIDISFSELFYIDGKFIYKENYFAVFIFKSIPLLAKIFSTCVVLILLYSLAYKKLKLMSVSLFFLLSLLLGPSLLVNEVFKNNFGRPRPDRVEYFGGKYKFIGPFKFSDACKKNCSFSSGHASIGFYFTVLSYLFRKNRKTFKLTFSLFFLFGCLVGMMRIIQGRHFLSDVVFSAFITFLTTHVLSFLVLKNEDKKYHDLTNNIQKTK